MGYPASRAPDLGGLPSGNRSVSGIDFYFFMAGLFGFLPSSRSSAATKVSRGDEEFLISSPSISLCE